MTLQNKTLLAISTCVAGTLVAIYFITRMIVAESFQQLEDSLARDNTRRVVEVLNNELDYLSAFAGVIADRYAISPVVDEQFLEQLKAGSGKNVQTSLRYNLVALYAPDGRLTGGLYYDPQEPDRDQFPDAWKVDMSVNHPLFIPSGSSGRTQGIIRAPDGRALLLGSSRLQRMTGDRQQWGTLVLGRVLDAAELQQISRIAKLSLQLIDIEDTPRDAGRRELYRSLITGAPNQVRIRDANTINGYAVLKDIQQRPAYIIETAFARDLYNQGRAIQDYFTKILLIVGILTILVTGLLMNQLVLARLTRLGRELTDLKTSSDPSRRVLLDGNDEFARLAAMFNDLLSGLQDARAELEKQVAERISTQNELTRNQELYRRAEAIVKLGHWEWDEIANRMVACSEQYAAIHGLTVTQALQRFSSRGEEQNVIHPEDRDRVQTAINQAREGRTALDIEYRIVLDNGMLKHVHRVSEPILARNGRLIRSLGTLQDITRQKQQQERLEQYQKRLSVLMSQLALVEEQERRRIATGLHDSTIQNLGLSKFKLFVLQKSLPDNIPQGPLNEVIETIDRAIKDTRSLVFELSPPVLYELGFVPAVEWLAEQVYVQRGLVCEVYSDDLPKPLDSPIMVMLFQIVRELLVNCAKHAGASKAIIRINRIADRIRIEVSDDGSGFETGVLDDSMSGQHGFGLFSIRERLINIGEQLRVESGPGGTTISFSVPLKPEPVAEI